MLFLVLMVIMKDLTVLKSFQTWLILFNFSVVWYICRDTGVKTSEVILNQSSASTSLIAASDQVPVTVVCSVRALSAGFLRCCFVSSGHFRWTARVQRALASQTFTVSSSPCRLRSDRLLRSTSRVLRAETSLWKSETSRWASSGSVCAADRSAVLWYQVFVLLWIFWFRSPGLWGSWTRWTGWRWSPEHRLPLVWLLRTSDTWGWA